MQRTSLPILVARARPQVYMTSGGPFFAAARVNKGSRRRNLTTDTMQVLITKYKQKLQALTAVPQGVASILSSTGAKPATAGGPSSSSSKEMNSGTESKTAASGGAGVHKKTVAEMDEELRLKMEEGMGGAAGVEYEDGKAEGLKRGVKANMFRVI